MNGNQMEQLRLEDRINTFSRFYKEKYGKKIFKIGLSTGLECPRRLQHNPCVFCEPHSFIDETAKSFSSITDQIEYMTGKLTRQYGDIGFIAYFQDNTSTYGDLDYLVNLFRQADIHPLIQEIIVSTRPDYLNPEILDIFQHFSKEVRIEIGLQTINDKSLRFLNRNHSQQDNINALALIKEFGLKTGVHLIMGIPGENKNDIMETIGFLIRNKIDEIKFHHLVVYKNTRLAELYETVNWECAYHDLNEYCELLGEIFPYISPDTVISRFFTSNLNRHNNALNQFPGIKKIWINHLTKMLNEKNIYQGSKYIR